MRPGGFIFRTLRWAGSVAPCAAALVLSIAAARQGETQIEISGATRLRIDAYDNPFFGLAEVGGFTSYQYRTSVSLRARSASGWSAYGELGLYGERGGGDRERSLDRNDGDLFQAFVEYGRQAAGWSWQARAGRQRNPQGNSRLNAAREAPNAIRTFDGVSVVGEKGKTRLSLFALQPVRLSPGFFDDETNDAESFWGIYLGQQDVRERINLDLYYFGRRDESVVWAQGSGDETRHSVGGRIFGRLGGTDLNVETIYQFGNFASGEISAWGGAFDVNIPVTGCCHDHRLGVRGNAVSGDRDTEDKDLQTFSAIYPRFTYYSDAATIAPTNALDVQVYGMLEPRDSLTVNLSAGRIWRLRRMDAVYRVPYDVLALPQAGEGRHVADIASVSAEWRVTGAVTVESAYVFSEPGAVLEGTGADDLHYANLSLTWAY